MASSEALSGKAKNNISRSVINLRIYYNYTIMREIPKWLKDMVAKNKAAYHTSAAKKTQENLDLKLLPTVCQEARCPNRGECFCHGEATIMILGSLCTRACKYCAVSKAKPLPPAEDEPARAAQLVQAQRIKYLVLTMPTRDDLPDGGARHIHNVVKAVKEKNPLCLVEPLISDLGGKFEHLPLIIESGCDVLGHNIETVPSLFKAVRPGASYERSLDLLKKAKEIKPSLITKSGVMVGLGESDAELKQTFKDLRSCGVELLTLGQYLAPSALHYPVQSYPEPAWYEDMTSYCLSIGFKGVMGGPLVRSSYRAAELYGLAQ